MRFHVLSDIHSNWPALVQLWRYVESSPQLHADHTYCIGDVIGYLGWPVECWQWVLDHTNDYEHLRLGNHDLAAARWNSAGRYGTNHLALFSLALHRAMLRNTEPQFLQDLETMAGVGHSQEDPTAQQAFSKKYMMPLVVSDGPFQFLMVHGNLCDDRSPELCTGIGGYVDPSKSGTERVRRALNVARELYAPAPDHLLIVIMGHTHRPAIAFLDDMDHVHLEDVDYHSAQTDAVFNVFDWADRLETDYGLTFERIKGMLINPGSVGQPRDGLGEQQNGTIAAHALHVDTTSGELRFVVNRYKPMILQSRFMGLRLGDHFDDTDWRGLHHNLNVRYGEAISDDGLWLLKDDAQVRQLGVTALQHLPDGLQTREDLMTILKLTYDSAMDDIQLVYERLWSEFMWPLILRLCTEHSPFLSETYHYTVEGFARKQTDLR